MVIRCPKCTKGLKLRDSSKLGKKARCPKCRHVFVMQLPTPQPESEDDEDEIQMELAQPVEGTDARWVPDNAPAGQASPVATASQAPGQFPGVAIDPAPQLQTLAEVGQKELGGAAALKEIKRKGAKRRKASIIAGVVTAFAVVGVVYAAKTYESGEKERRVQDAKPKADEQLADTKEELRNQRERAKAASPTEGGTIPTNMLPMGCKVIISIRPAELWAEQSQGQEFMYCLGEEFGGWIASEIERLCLYPPQQIEHAVIGIITGQRGEVPEAAAVVRLLEDQKKSELIIRFGTQTDEYGYPVYVDDERSYVMKDLKTIAIAPASAAKELADSVNYPSVQSDGIDAILNETDVDRHITVLFEPVVVSRHRDTLFAPETADLIEHSLRFFNDVEIESVAWSMHLGEQKFFSEILMRNTTTIREHLLEKEMRRKLKKLPFDLLHMVELMNPKQAGRRKLIGRFPGMMQVFAKSTIGGMGERYAQLTTQLSERAAPNIALAGLLAWDEAINTDFASAVPQVPTDSGPKLPDLMVDRLKMKIDVEFNREPLKDAFAYIAGECKLKSVVNGDALKDKGYTQNMPQTFVMQDAGLVAIKQIVDQYEGMCIVIQQDKGQFLVTTTKFAEQDGQTPYKFE